MKRAGVCLGLLLASSGCGDDAGSAAQSEPFVERVETHRQLAKHWAPRFYQDTDASYVIGDYITNFNFDGDYNGKNNWENLSRFDSVPAYVYYAVSETETHYFLHYAVFHPRDWHEWLAAEMHENDLEGVSLAVEKTGGFGSLIAMETLAHDQFYQYRAVTNVVAGSDDVDGVVTLHDGRAPRLFIEAKGHGIFVCDERCESAPGGDGIVYAEGGFAESPRGGDGNFSRVYAYQLIALDADGSIDGNEGFWHRRNDICDTCTFGRWGKLRGDDYGVDRAKAPWAWDDPDDGEVFAGAMLCDPALMFDVHLGGEPFASRFSHQYVWHPFYTHWFDVIAVKSVMAGDMLAGSSDLYVSISSPGSPSGSDLLHDANVWRKNDATVGSWYRYQRGQDEATGQRDYALPFGSHHFCRPGASPTRFAVYDHDATTDDLLGSLTLRETADYSQGVEFGSAELKVVYEVRH